MDEYEIDEYEYEFIKVEDIKLNDGIYDFTVEEDPIRVVIKWDADIPLEERMYRNLDLVMYGNLDIKEKIFRKFHPSSSYKNIGRADFYIFKYLLTNFQYEFKNLGLDDEELDYNLLKKINKTVYISTHSRDGHDVVMYDIHYEHDGYCPKYISEATNTRSDDDIDFKIDIETGRILNWNPELFYKYLYEEINEKRKKKRNKKQETRIKNKE